jgi:hypothetical protein
MAEKETPIIIIGGVRYRKEDAARLGLTEESGTKSTAKKKGASDAGTVSGDTGGSGDTDKAAGEQPGPITSSKQGK